MIGGRKGLAVDGGVTAFDRDHKRSKTKNQKTYLLRS